MFDRFMDPPLLSESQALAIVFSPDLRLFLIATIALPLWLAACGAHEPALIE
jgi:fumarate reductase subunit D